VGGGDWRTRVSILRRHTNEIKLNNCFNFCHCCLEIAVCRQVDVLIIHTTHALSPIPEASQVFHLDAHVLPKWLSYVLIAVFLYCKRDRYACRRMEPYNISPFLPSCAVNGVKRTNSTSGIDCNQREALYAYIQQHKFSYKTQSQTLVYYWLETRFQPSELCITKHFTTLDLLNSFFFKEFSGL
jgi:hypothetical protein